MSMSIVTKGLFLACLVALITRNAAAAACTGDKTFSDVPYTVSSTVTGDASTTTLLMTVCSVGCDDAPDTCSPLKSISVGASDVTTTPSSGTDDCGVSFGADALGSLAASSPATKQCEAFYMTTNTPDAAPEDICGGSECQVVLALDNGVTAAGPLGGNIPDDLAGPEDPVDAVPIATEEEPVPVPDSSAAPSPYRRRRLNAVEREMFAGRTLSQYGRRL